MMTLITLPRWWACPNDPPCPHGSVLHEHDEDGTRLCCVDGCGCGDLRLEAKVAK